MAHGRQAAVVQGTGHEPGGGARGTRPLKIGPVADAARADQRHLRRTGLQLAQGVEVGAGIGADALERHHDHARGPQRGPVPAAGRIEPLAVAAVERKHGIASERRGEAGLEGRARAQRFAGKDADDAWRLGGKLRAQGCGRRGIGKARVEPDFNPGHGVRNRAQRRLLRWSALQRVEIGHVQLPRIAVRAKCRSQPRRFGTGAQTRFDRPIVLAIAAYRAHHLAVHEVDDGDEIQGSAGSENNAKDNRAMKRVWIYEYLSGGGVAGAVGEGASAEAELLAAGTSMRDALLADLVEVEGWRVAAASSPHAAALPPGAAPTCADAGESPLDFVARQSALHDAIWLVAPETDGLLAQFQRLVAPERWLGCRAEAIAVAGSKRATAVRLAAQGVLTPLGFADDPATRRWVTKPDDGAGAVATLVHTDRSAARDELAARTCAGESAVLEAWVEGAALSLSLLCRHEGVELLSVNRQHIAVDAQGRLSFEGVSFEASAMNDPRRVVFERLASQVARAIPGLRGTVGIDLVWHASRGPVVIEVNPRLTCAYVGLSKALGRNLAGEWLAAHSRAFADAR